MISSFDDSSTSVLAVAVKVKSELYRSVIATLFHFGVNSSVLSEGVRCVVAREVEER